MLPVLVVLSGEHFRYSEGHLYDGTVLSSYGRLVVVTLNYRLGLLGKTTTRSYALLHDQCFTTMINIEANHRYVKNQNKSMITHKTFINISRVVSKLLRTHSQFFKFFIRLINSKSFCNF